MDEFDDILGGLTVTDGPNGTMDIEGVPIFNVGLVRNGKTYDEAWANRAIEAHNKLKEADGYIPPVFIGHTTDGEEKPAVGLFDNLRLQGRKLLADFKRVSADTYKQLKDGNWPSRSIEATNSEDDARVLGLALLGSSTPACKFKPLHMKELLRFSGNPDDVEALVYDEYIVNEAIEKKESKMADEKTPEEIKAEEDKVAAEKLAEEKAATEKLEQEKVEAQKLADEKAEADKLEAEEAAKQDALDKLEENEAVQMTERVRKLEAENLAIKTKMVEDATTAHRGSIDAFVDKLNVQGKLPLSAIRFEGEEKKLSLNELMYTMKAEELTKMEQFLQTLDTVAKFKDSAPAGDEEKKADPGKKFAADVEAHFEENKEKEGWTYLDSYNAVNGIQK